MRGAACRGERGLTGPLLEGSLPEKGEASQVQYWRGFLEFEEEAQSLTISRVRYFFGRGLSGFSWISSRPCAPMGGDPSGPRESSGVPGPSFWSLFDSRNRPGDENGEMLENDDPYSTLAMFLRSQEPQHEVKMNQERPRGQ